MTNSHPGGIIRRRYLEPLDLTLSALAEALDVSVSSVSRVVGEKADVSSDMALRLSYVLGGTPQMWLNLQANHNLVKAKQALDTSGLKKLNPSAGQFQEEEEQDDDEEDAA